LFELGRNHTLARIIFETLAPVPESGSGVKFVRAPGRKPELSSFCGLERKNKGESLDGSK